MKIRRAKLDDAVSIRALLDELGYPCALELTRRRLAQLTADPSEDILVAEAITGEVLAFISIHYIPQIALEGDFARISYFCVAGASRSKGIGKRFEEEAIRLASARGCDRIELHCHSRRREAHRFYHRQGYDESPKYLMKTLKEANQSLEPTAPSGRGSS